MIYHCKHWINHFTICHTDRRRSDTTAQLKPTDLLSMKNPSNFLLFLQVSQQPNYEVFFSRISIVLLLSLHIDHLSNRSPNPSCPHAASPPTTTPAARLEAVLFLRPRAPLQRSLPIFFKVCCLSSLYRLNPQKKYFLPLEAFPPIYIVFIEWIFRGSNV